MLIPGPGCVPGFRLPVVNGAPEAPCADLRCRGDPLWEKPGRKEGLGALRGGVPGSVIFSLLGPGRSLLHSQSPGIVGPEAPCASADGPSSYSAAIFILEEVYPSSHPRSGSLMSHPFDGLEAGFAKVQEGENFCDPTWGVWLLPWAAPGGREPGLASLHLPLPPCLSQVTAALKLLV